MKQEWKLRKPACLSFRAQVKCRWHTSSIYWGQLQGPMTKLTDKGTSGHGEEVQLFSSHQSSYFKAMPRKDENISRIQRSRTVASCDASFGPQSSWAVPHHCVVMPVLHSCSGTTCDCVTGEDKPWREYLWTGQSSVERFDCSRHGFLFTRSPSSLILVSSSHLFN